MKNSSLNKTKLAIITLNAGLVYPLRMASIDISQEWSKYNIEPKKSYKKTTKFDQLAQSNKDKGIR